MDSLSHFKLTKTCEIKPCQRCDQTVRRRAFESGFVSFFPTLQRLCFATVMTRSLWNEKKNQHWKQNTRTCVNILRYLNRANENTFAGGVSKTSSDNSPPTSANVAPSSHDQKRSDSELAISWKTGFQYTINKLSLLWDVKFSAMLEK